MAAAFLHPRNISISWDIAKCSDWEVYSDPTYATTFLSNGGQLRSILDFYLYPLDQ
jgi:hypothetical protein